MMNMSEIAEFGIRADERQQLENYKAGYQAFRIMTGLGIVAMAVAVLALREEAIAAGIAVVVLTGLAVYEHQSQKSGWEDYVQEQVAGNMQVRRRVWRSIVIRAAILSGFGVLYNLIVDEKPLGSALMYGVIQGVAISVVYWWYEIHIAVQKKKKGLIGEATHR